MLLDLSIELPFGDVSRIKPTIAKPVFPSLLMEVRPVGKEIESSIEMFKNNHGDVPKIKEVISQ